MLEHHIFQIAPNCELEIASSLLFSLLILSTFLSVYSGVIQSKQDDRHTDYNLEFQTEIESFLEFKSLSQVKTKVWLSCAKNIKMSGIEAEIEESLNRWDLSKFEHEVDQKSQTEFENHRVGRGKRLNKNSRVNKSRSIDKTNKGRKASRTIRVRRVDRAGWVRRVRRERNRSVITNRTRVKKAEIAETDKQYD